MKIQVDSQIVAEYDILPGSSRILRGRAFYRPPQGDQGPEHRELPDKG